MVDAGPLASLPALEVLVLDDNLVEEIGAFLESAALRVLGLSGNPLSPGSLDRFEELAARGVEVEYLHGPPAPEGDGVDTFTPPPLPPETDWRILVETGLESSGRGGNVLYSLGPDDALTRITGRRGLTLGVDVSSDGRWLARCLWPTGDPSGVSFLLLLTPGEVATRVATDGDWSITPAFSPDGRSLAYASGSLEHTDLFLYTMDSGASRVLVNDVGSASHPTWSPDGRRLAFSSYEGDSDAELYTLDLSTNVVTRLTYNEAHDDAPAWSPAGGQLAFRSDRDGNLDLYVLDLASGQVRRLTDLAGHAAWPHWSPDGERLVFSSFGGGERFGLHKIDAGGGEARPLTDDDLSLYATGWSGRLDPAFGTALRSGLFADDALDEAVRLAAGRAPSEPLSEGDLPGVLQMRTLSPVFDLQGIGRLASLSVLHLWFESRVDLSPLAALPGLTELYLRGGPLDDLGPLAGLSDPGDPCRMSGGEASDLSALSGMSLRRLEILDNALLDLTTLGPVEVRGLTLVRCAIEDVSPLASLSSVLTLDLSGNRDRGREPPGPDVVGGDPQPRRQPDLRCVTAAGTAPAATQPDGQPSEPGVPRHPRARHARQGDSRLPLTEKGSPLCGGFPRPGGPHGGDPDHPRRDGRGTILLPEAAPFQPGDRAALGCRSGSCAPGTAGGGAACGSRDPLVALQGTEAPVDGEDGRVHVQGDSQPPGGEASGWPDDRRSRHNRRSRSANCSTRSRLLFGDPGRDTRQAATRTTRKGIRNRGEGITGSS